LASAGARVVVADIDGKRAEKLAASINSDSEPRAIGVAVNVAEKASVQHLISQTLSSYGRIDGLVNNAALDPKFTPQQASQNFYGFEDYPLELWDRSLAVNVTGMFLCAQAVAPTMLSQRQGVIVNVSSMYGLVGPDQRLYEHDDPEVPRKFKPVDYSVTKSAVLGLTHYLATYWAGKGIRVNTLTPGGVFNEHEPEFVRRYNVRTPLGRMAQKSEYCGALVFLLSDASSYMTGSNLVIDGGWTAW
jgi:NAD(P)-dependent dehydrogenase (short-subunit alcohol dehydrogenase family)